MIKGAVITIATLLLAAVFGWFVVLAIQSFMRDHPNDDDDDHLWPSV
jgi:hypothetical protein